MMNKSTNTAKTTIIDKVICFLLCGMNSATADNVQKIAVATFTFEEIKHSVDLLSKPDEGRGKNKTSNDVADLMKKKMNGRLIIDTISQHDADIVCIMERATRDTVIPESS